MLQLLQALRTAYSALSLGMSLNDVAGELNIKAATTDEILNYLSQNHPDIVALQNGDVTSLTFHAVSYSYPLKNADGHVMLDELHDPIKTRAVHFRYVGAGTSASSATYLKMLDDRGFFETNRVAKEVHELQGNYAFQGKDALVEVKWNSGAGFDSHDIKFNVKEIVADQEKRIDLIEKLSSLPSFDSRMAELKRSQLNYESAVTASLSLEKKLEVQSFIDSKNAALKRLQDSVDDYEKLRKEMAAQQGLSFIKLLLGWAAIGVSAAKAAESELQRNEMHTMWNSLNSKLEDISTQVKNLQPQIDALGSKLNELGKSIPSAYEIHVMISIVPTSHNGVFQPVPLAKP